MTSDSLAAQALQAFDQAVAMSGQFRSRPGQRRMAEQVARTLSAATLGRPADEASGPPVRAIAVVQAGTGVGKSLAYCAPAIALALARNTRVVISTATVALQEQLVLKDLPALAALMPQPFRFALAKGRGRYVCRLKLDRIAQAVETGGSDPLFDEAELDAGSSWSGAGRDTEARQVFFRELARTVATQQWDGDRDSLMDQPDAADWAAVAADASSCTGRHCPAFGSCTYFERRKDLVGAQVIVANHDLLLSTLGARVLPELDNCLLILDEAHHLPAVALDQFSCSMDLSRLGWIDTLATRARKVAAMLNVSEAADLGHLASQLHAALQAVAGLCMELTGGLPAGAESKGTGAGASASGGLVFQPANAFSPARVRFEKGCLPQALHEPLDRVQVVADAYLEVLAVVAQALRDEIKDKPDEARALSVLYAQIGTLAPRLEDVANTTRWLLQVPPDGVPPPAKWLTLHEAGGLVVVRAHAGPIMPGSTLRTHLWSVVRGAIATSATLTSCGNFDFFLRECGLQDDAAVTALEVESPFDYLKQGRFVLVDTPADPRIAAQYTPRMVQELLSDLEQVKRGALVLFTSREQMRVAVDTLPRDWVDRVQVQGTLPRPRLLQRHRDRVEEGQPSIIFGMQSFGEGLDLPGELCEAVFITKLPFAPPDDPLGEARAEWLRNVGRDPFSELVVPATAIKLAQWAGRAIRTETDSAQVTCYDRRLLRTAYGRRLLQGLPAFAREVRGADGITRPMDASPAALGPG